MSKPPSFNNRLWSLAGTKLLIYFMRIAKIGPFHNPLIDAQKNGLYEGLSAFLCKFSHVVESRHWLNHKEFLHSILFRRQRLWRCRLMVLCEGPSSTNNVRDLVLGRCSTISSKASSTTTEGLHDMGLSSELVSPFSKRLNQFYATRSLTVPGPSTSLISFTAFIAVGQIT